MADPREILSEADDMAQAAEAVTRWLAKRGDTQAAAWAMAEMAYELKELERDRMEKEKAA